MAYNVDFAIELLDIAVEFNKLWSFLVGGPSYCLNAPNGYGEKEHNITLVMQAIYKKFEVDPTIKEKFQDAIKYYISVSRNGDGMLKILEIIKYQMSSQKVGTAPFALNCEELLIAVKENIIRNREFYVKHFDDLPSGTFMVEFERYDNEFNKKCGTKIL